MDTPSSRKILSHAPERNHADTLAGPTDVGASTSRQRACLVCGRSLAGRRPETTSCTGRCRAALARQRRRHDLVARVHRAEASLREAAVALASLKELAGLDSTLEVGSLLVPGGRR
jgi:predicted nucleic acid-binding Zn ribbon protein